jgi:hypothetical protein
MRSKLKLNLDELTIDSFDTTAGEKGRGTVMGEEQCTCWTQCGQNTCPGCPTCDASCNGTCGAATCGASCYGTCNEATCGYSCDGWCTQYDATCNGYGTCGVWPCKDVP